MSNDTDDGPESSAEHVQCKIPTAPTSTSTYSRIAGDGFSILGACAAASVEAATCLCAYYIGFPNTQLSFLYALAVGTVAFMAIVAFAVASPTRHIDISMALSSYIFVVPGMAMWAAGYPAFGISIAYIAGSATAADALRPFDYGDRNLFWYSFDMVLTASNFAWCIVSGVAFIKCALSNFKHPYTWLYIVWCGTVWAVPLVFWKWSGDIQSAGKKAGGAATEAWRPYHMLWHVVAVSCCTVGCLSGKFACEYGH